MTELTVSQIDRGLYCEHCHEAAHGRQMAPRVTFHTDGKMLDHEFGLFREYWKQNDLARFDGFDECWYVPAADMKYLVQTVPTIGGTVGGRVAPLLSRDKELYSRLKNVIHS